MEKLIEKKSWIELREMRMPHSIDSHRLYFVWLNAISKESGIDKNELHYLYRARFLQKPENEITKLLRPSLWIKIKSYTREFVYFQGMNIVIDIISESTSPDNLDSARFTKYLKEIQNHARVNFDIILCSLKDMNFTEFYRKYGFE